jgi:hypothetical protein
MTSTVKSQNRRLELPSVEREEQRNDGGTSLRHLHESFEVQAEVESFGSQGRLVMVAATPTPAVSG